MTPEQFVYWLQGYVEIDAHGGDEVGITRAQWQVIKDHLKEVFHKKTPDHPLGATVPPFVPSLPAYPQQNHLQSPPFPPNIIC